MYEARALPRYHGLYIKPIKKRDVYVGPRGFHMVQFSVGKMLLGMIMIFTVVVILLMLCFLIL